MRLLYKTEKINKEKFSNATSLFEDLEVDKLLCKISIFGNNKISSKELFDVLSSDPETIKYRQELFKYLLENQNLYNNLVSAFPNLCAIKEVYNERFSKDKTYIQDTMKGVNQLYTYLNVLTQLNVIFKSNAKTISHEGLKNLEEELLKISKENNIKNLDKNVNNMRNIIIKPESGRIGINLDSMLYPKEAFGLAVEKGFFYPYSIVKSKKNKSGIGKFKNEYINSRPHKYPMLSKVQSWQSFTENEYIGALSNLNKSLNFPPSKGAHIYIKEKMNNIFSVINDLKIVLGLVNLLKEIKETGMPLCIPEVGIKEDKNFQVEDIYNIFLALFPNKCNKSPIIKNSIDYEKNGLSYVLTGANKGGKTTLLQAIGITSVLFHLGMYIPGTYGKISPCDCIYTHYQKEETNMDREGRLAYESKSFQNIFSSASENSLILINEAFASTSPSEGEYLSLQILIGLKLLNCRGLMVTHFHKLLNRINVINKEIPDKSKIKALSLGVKESNNIYERTYKLSDTSTSKSYAMDIVREYSEKLFDKKLE